MASEKLTVELDAKTGKLTKPLADAEKQLDGLGKTANTTGKKVETFAAKFKKANDGVKAGAEKMKPFKAALKKVVGTAAAATAAMILLYRSVGQYAKEITTAAKLSNMAVGDFQQLAYATGTVGIGIEQLGDISKDTLEKLGDYLNTGGGGFQDFADAMKMSKREAKKTAKEFSTLSGPEVLQKMVTMMEGANVSSVQMSHALEGMASETTRLIPLLKDGGKAAKELSDRFAAVTVPLSEEDIKKFKDVGESVDIAGTAISSLKDSILLSFADDFIKAAEAVSYFFASFNEGTIAYKKDELEDARDLLHQMKHGGGRMKQGKTYDDGKGGRTKINPEIATTEALIAKLEKEIHELANPTVITKVKTDAENIAAVKEEIKNGLSNSVDDDSFDIVADEVTTTEDAAIEALENRFRTEKELLAEKLQEELDLAGNNYELQENLKAAHIQKLADIDDKAERKDQRAKDRIARKEEREQSKKERTNYKNAHAAVELMDMVFKNKKASGVASAIINTAEGISAAIKDQNYVGAALSASIGMAQVTTIMNTEPGSTGSIATPPSAPADLDFTPDTGSLELSTGDGGSMGSRVITFDTETGDDLVDAISDALNKGQKYE